MFYDDSKPLTRRQIMFRAMLKRAYIAADFQEQQFKKAKEKLDLVPSFTKAAKYGFKITEWKDKDGNLYFRELENMDKI